jgi:F0F1-type ATP synthase assembly protein I
VLKSKLKKDDKVWTAYSLALNLGYMIITPILIFGVGGVLLDKYLNTSPLFILIGFFVSITSSLGIVYIKMKDIIVQGIPKKGIPKTSKK